MLQQLQTHSVLVRSFVGCVGLVVTEMAAIHARTDQAAVTSPSSLAVSSSSSSIVWRRGVESDVVELLSIMDVALGGVDETLTSTPLQLEERCANWRSRLTNHDIIFVVAEWHYNDKIMDSQAQQSSNLDATISNSTITSLKPASSSLPRNDKGVKLIGWCRGQRPPAVHATLCDDIKIDSECMNLFVLPQWQRYGIGTVLWQLTRRQMIQQYQPLNMLVWSVSTATSWYKKQGGVAMTTKVWNDGDAPQTAFIWTQPWPTITLPELPYQTVHQPLSTAIPPSATTPTTPLLHLISSPTVVVSTPQCTPADVRDKIV
jgi:GNAT superfamily N-acetyltransferase